MPRQVTLVLATRNAHKVAELSRLLEGRGVECASLEAYPGVPEVVEDRDTLRGNAEKKAAETARACGTWALADDTGLEVEALGGAPGVYSARWAGPGCSYADNCAKLVRELTGVPAPRRAAFRTVLALSNPEGRTECVEGRLEGEIVESPRGAGGFGYDPLFALPDGRTLAELSPDEKNAVGHRGRALRAMLPKLQAVALLLAVSLVVLPARPCRAEKTEPGQETIWDQIMAQQARRGLSQGNELLQEKDYPRALDEIKRSVADDPKDPLGHIMLGVAQYWNGLVDDSIASYKTAIELDPDNAEAHLLLGISYAWKDDSPGAETEFRRATVLDPTRADAQMNLGSIRESDNDYPGALDLFRRAVDLDKKNPLYRFQLGSLYRKLGRDADAVAQFKEAVSLQPDYEDALLELGCAQDRLGDPAAVATLKKAVDLKPGDSVARMRLARLLLEDGQVKKARAVLAGAFHLTPEGGGAGLQLSVSFAGGHRPAPAGAGGQGPSKPQPKPAPEPDANDPLSMFERNLRRVPLDQAAVMHVDAVFLPRPKLVKDNVDEGSSLKRALAAAAAGGPDEAPKAVRRDYPLTAADAAGREAQIKKVMDDLRAVMASAPQDSDARLGMNLTYTHPTDVGRADADPGTPPKVTYEPRQVGNDMGLWVIGTGWMALVAEVLPEPGEEPPHADSADWWTVIGLAHATVGDSQLAMAAFMDATRLDPGSATAWLGRAVAAVMSGDEAEAVSALRRALAIDPQDKAASDGLKWLLRPSAAEETPK
ncbi:MAG TPA: RdgB/HAM1 family non-canonical purine NTP pyrophosphatase [Elusimicrobiota bacterium]|nr:RdgB/HAM1 family non-canonical purine NTP pyrophosphatase [Elusimicrobiota bacterium]